jgi:hypothetical protein
MNGTRRWFVLGAAIVALSGYKTLKKRRINKNVRSLEFDLIMITFSLDEKTLSFSNRYLSNIK